jgi:hypothetical protein
MLMLSLLEPSGCLPEFDDLMIYFIYLIYFLPGVTGRRLGHIRMLVLCLLEPRGCLPLLSQTF